MRMNHYPIRYAFRLDTATEKALEQISRHTFQSKASIMRRYVQEGIARDASEYAKRSEELLLESNFLARIQR